MTLTHTRPVRTTADVVRGFGAVLALVVFVVGVPAALVALAPIYLPEQIHGWGQLWDRIVSPDDGTLLLAVLAGVAWIAWAAFTVSVLVELVAAVRRLRAPAVPLLGGFQRTAARLLATAGLLLATASAVTMPAAPAAARSVVVPLDHSAPPTPPMATPHDTASGDGPAAPEHAPMATALPTVVVQRGDTLWDIAARHLGDPLRYTQIRDLNLGRPQPDGGRLRDADWLQPGWTLLLPADATGVEPAAPPEPAAAADEASVVVQPGDTLWDIAQAHLGDGARYGDIAALNAGVEQPDGGRLTDPDRIRPGWILRLPTDQAAPATTSSATASADPTPGTPPLAPAVDPPPPAPAELAPPKDATVPAAGPVASDAVPPPIEADDPSDPQPARTWFLGFAALGAVGIVGEIARRRHLQQRARKVGETIPLPEPGSPAATAERLLRGAATPVSIDAIRTTLTNLAHRCFDAGRDLPRIGALLLDEHHLMLLLVDEAPEPVEPFTAPDPRTWIAGTADVATELVEDPDQVNPYPLLVVLGHTDDATLLLNLEAAGTLAIVGDDIAAEDALRALVMETATSDLSSQLAVHVDEPLADFEGAFEDFRLSATDGADSRATIEANVAKALEGTGHDDTLQMRGDPDAADLWLPYVYVEHTLRSAPSAPWRGVVTITRQPTDAAWTSQVAADGSGRLEPLGVNYQPQRLTAEHAAHLRSVLAIALPPQSRRTPHSLTTTVADDVDALHVAQPLTAPAVPDAPTVTINVLGPIQIHGLPPGQKPLTAMMQELLVYLALHGPATGTDLDESIWNGQRVDPQTRATLIHRTRQRAGTDALPVAGRWQPLHLGDAVTTDWSRFQRLVAEALPDIDQRRIDGLTQALALVRGRPFQGIEGSTYTWADYDIQHMTSAIADAAHVLARLHAEQGNHRNAVIAAMRGLAVEPFSEPLQQLALAATEATAGREEAQRLRRRFTDAMIRLDPELA